MSNEQMIRAMEHYYGIPADMCDAFIKASWAASWKASRELMVIDLPKTTHAGGPDDNIYWPADIHAAIEAAGVKVKS
ncbi:hypothetical protein CCL11_25770 [Pseudomonas syringae]|uniref:hypothetical protein n=1 Tax=Pseudomonas syringae TaxID=317 RepID=UPI000BB60B52|nr:hypothetical protein [Pseudomonas syringae]PBP34596.1 hypothetical protein CCL11_25770 [Pseudomonas syringae]